MKKTITYLGILLLSGGIFYEMYSNLNGASSQTGAPGELTCSQSGCHGSGNGEGSSGGLADNTGGGSVSISGISGTYVPGAVYHFTVTVNQLGGTRFGFNFEALDASNASVGSYSITLSGTWLRSGINGTRQGISQGHSGSSGPTAGAGSDFYNFTFDWTAPASSVGPITFYACGNAVNQDGLNDSGDQVYYTSITANPTIAPASQILISRTSFTFPSFYALANTIGNSQVFWAAGQALSGNLTAAVTGSTQFQISSSPSGPWVSSIPLNATGGVVNGTPIYVQYTGPASGTQTATVTISGGGATSKSIPLSGVVRTGATVPSISIPNPTSLNFGTVPVGGGASPSMTVAITYTNPVAPVTITMPSGYEISSSPSYDYHSSLTTGFVGLGFPLTAYVRLRNPQTVNTFNGNMIISTPGAVTQTVALTATSTMPAQVVLTSTDYLSLFTSNPGAPSATQTMSVNGMGLTSTLDVAAPTNFEVSLSASTGFSSSVSIAPTGGNVAATTVYVRYNNPAAGLDGNSITVGSTGANTQFVNVNGDCFGSSTTNIKNTAAKTEDVTVFPNPSSGIVFLKTNSDIQGKYVSVTDISGKTIMFEKINSANQWIDLNIYPAGVYMVGIIDANMKNISYQKVVLSK